MMKRRVGSLGCPGVGVAAFPSYRGAAVITGRDSMDTRSSNQGSSENCTEYKMSSLCFQPRRSPCFVCGQAALAERTQTVAFRLCPACARLLRWLRTRLSEDSELRFNSISLASSFADDLRIDSLSMIEFIMDLEQESGVNISDDTIAKVRTVEDVVRYVRLRSAG